MVERPRGLLLKVALAVGAEDLCDGLREALEHNEPEPEFWPALIADLEAMAERAAT